MITVLQLVGLGDRNEVLLVTTDDSGQKRFLEIPQLSPLLEVLNPQQFRHKKVLFGGESSHINIEIAPDLIYNSVGDPDRCSKVLQRLQKASAQNDFPYINHPDNIPRVRPDNLYLLAKEIEGMEAIKAIRIAPRSLTEVEELLHKYNIHAPFIVKEAGLEPEQSHSYLFKKTDDLHDLERFAFDGRAYYIRPFYDYRSKDRLYRKYRFFVIGDKILPGHLIISKEWYIKDDIEAHKGLENKFSTIEAEEKAFLKKYQKKRMPALLSLKEKLGLDFFAVDCSINDKGKIILFNVDCEAHYFERCKKEGYYLPKQIQRLNEAVETMVVNKLQRYTRGKDA